MIFYIVAYKGCDTLKTAIPQRDTTCSGQSSCQSELEIAPLIDFGFYKIVLSWNYSKVDHRFQSMFAEWK